MAGQLRRYQRAWLRWDLLAGLTTAAVVVPQAVAYASLAGLPVQIGLYVATVPWWLRAAGHLAAAQRQLHLDHLHPHRRCAHAGRRRRRRQRDAEGEGLARPGPPHHDGDPSAALADIPDHRLLIRPGGRMRG
jgi:hypothetical protein